MLQMRKERKLGHRRMQSELYRLHDKRLSLATIHKLLARLGLRQLSPKRSWRKQRRKSYSRPIPGDRVQIDVCKILPGLYQYTAIDDCSRYKVIALYQRKIATNTLNFLERVMEEMPFPIQRVQTDRGREFFAVKVQQCLMGGSSSGR